MYMKKKFFAALLILILPLLWLAWLNTDGHNFIESSWKLALSKENKNYSDGRLKVSFIDVGQGDSILLETPEGNAMLIDAGGNDCGHKVVEYIKKQNINRLDVLVGTHPHEDHIGGLDTVIKSFDIGKVYMPKVSTTTKTFEDVLSEIKEKGMKITAARAGMTIDLDPELTVRILAPNSEKYKDLNNYSVVLKVTYGKTSFLFTGDAEEKSENEMMGFDLKADVLKVGHHGSDSSTAERFLEAVSPEYAVISVGKHNDYGHPDEKILERLENSNVKVYRTDEDKTVVFISDGKEVTCLNGGN